jgi:hypothetical protein
MRRVVAVLGASAIAIGVGTAPAAADVHVVSQAACGASENSGATMSRDAVGRPDAPIPVTASEGRTQGKGGMLPGPFCDVPRP